MGRLISTIYRTLLLAFSVAAVVLSVLTATSCAFVRFDHQYATQGRGLADDGGATDAAELPEGALGDVSATLAATVAAPTAGTSATVFAPDALAGVGDMAGFGGNQGTSVDEVAAAASTTVDTAASADGATSATVFAPDALAGVGAMSGFHDNKGDSVVAGSAADSAAVDSAAPVDAAAATSATVFAPDLLDGLGDMTGFNDNKGDSALNDDDFVPANVAVKKSAAVAKMATAAATASGDAGLYCDGDQSFSVTNLWDKSVEELAEDLANEGDRNESEKLAQGGVALASVFGAVAAFLTAFTSLTGLRVCCERWVLGLVALCACLMQGITFLFFNSERYCDGDIIHEILNQEPCVIGQGGKYSIAAVVLYAVVFVMAFRLPQDNPYSPCCKKRNAKRNADKSEKTFVGDQQGGGAEEEGEGKPAQAPWLSGDKEKQVKEENEII